MSIASRWTSIRLWYTKLSRTKRLSISILGAIILILLVQGIVYTVLFYQSVTGEDLAMFLAVDNDSMTLRHGENATVGFNLGVRNLQLCEASCTWNVTDGASGKSISSGIVKLSNGNRVSDNVTVFAASRGEQTTIYQVSTVCQNAVNSYCRSSGEERYAASTFMVATRYTSEEAALRANISERLSSWTGNVSRELEQLGALALMNGLSYSDKRLASRTGRALADFDNLSDAYMELGHAIENDDLATATVLTSTVPVAPAISGYLEDVALERSLVTKYNTELKQRAGTAQALVLIASTQDALHMRQSNQDVIGAYNLFTRKPLNETGFVFNSFISLTDNLENSYRTIVAARTSDAQALLARENMQACTLGIASCPSSLNLANNTNNSLTQNVASLQASCANLSKMNLTFATARVSYGKSLDPNATINDLELSYNITGVRTRVNYSTFAELVREAARNGTLLTTDVSERLAVIPQVSAASAAFISQNCSFGVSTASLSQTDLVATIPTDLRSNIQLPVIKLAQPQCCALASCAACVSSAASKRYPVVFVHGFSFTQDTTPESNLNAFAPLATRLQEDGYLYAGHVFPQADQSSPVLMPLNSFPGDEGVTVTYYYDSYPEQGKTSFIVRKSENIETYAIRLREALNVVRHKTGASKVVLVAHSMGGLVARREMQLFGDSDIAAFVMIGTPNNGTSARTQQICPVFGSALECRDMSPGSVFLAKLNSGVQPSVPVFTITGVGCDGRDSDGVIDATSVRLPFANDTTVNGTCDGQMLLHSGMLSPAIHPEVYARVKQIIDQYSYKK